MGPRRVLMDESVTMEFIEEIREREWIWNPKDPNYNDRYYVMGTWKEIAHKFNIAEDILKLKWKSLRDLFRREMKTRNYPESLEEYDGRWRYFPVMWFVKSIECKGSTFPNHDILENDADTDPIASVEPDDVNIHIKVEPDNVDQTEFLEQPAPKKRKHYNDDEYDVMFLKSLMPYFKQLDPMRKLVVRSKIQNLLLEELSDQKFEEDKSIDS